MRRAMSTTRDVSIPRPEEISAFTASGTSRHTVSGPSRKATPSSPRTAATICRNQSA